MAPQSGYILITFIANYPTNNLYYRIGCTGPYTGPILIDCVPLIGDFVPGSECSYKIEPIMFENEACLDVCYDGYIEPTCAPGDPEQQLFWEKTFTPNPKCLPFTLTCTGVVQSGGIRAVDIIDPGDYEYQPFGGLVTCALDTLGSVPPHIANQSWCTNFDGTHLTQSCGSNSPVYCMCVFKPKIAVSPPTTPPIGQGGIQATVDAVMGYGGLTKDALPVFQGTGPAGLNAIFPDVPCDTPSNFIPTGPGVSIQGIGEQRFSVKVSNGKVVSCTPLLYPNQGKFFYSNEHFTFDPSLIGGVIGVIYKADPTSVDIGDIIAMEVTDPGLGYVSFPAPTFTISNLSDFCDASNKPAILDADTDSTTSIGPCPEFDPGLNCDGDPYLTGELIPQLQQGESFDICYLDPPASIPPSITVTPSSGCCYDCLEILVAASVSDPLPLIFYTNCTTNDIVIVQMTGYSLTITCAINNSWHSSESSTTFTPNGSCTS